MDVKDFFGKYAGKYAKSDSHAKGSDLDLLLNVLDVDETKEVLDLATGTGFTAIALAKKVRHVIALDKTTEMLDEARKLAASEGLKNIDFTLGEVEEIPSKDDFFDIVTSRRAPHHFLEKNKFLREALRVLKPGGRLGISDMVSPEGDKEDSYNELERIRDPSHVRAETLSSWKTLIDDAGFASIEATAYEDRTSFEKWLYPVSTDSVEGKRCRAFLDAATPEFKKLIGFMEEDDSFIKKRAVISAKKPE